MTISPLRPNAPGRPKDPEKRNAILEAAMQLFPSRGYDGVSMDALAQAAGVSKLTVYSHFEDKEALFDATDTVTMSPYETVFDFSKLDIDHVSPLASVQRPEMIIGVARLASGIVRVTKSRAW